MNGRKSFCRHLLAKTTETIKSKVLHSSIHKHFMDRRSFLKSSGLLVGGLYLSGKAFANILAKDQGKPITGTVKHRGKGIANAVISNGYEVVLTDKKGRYHLPANAQAQHVFLSTPAGYQIKSV